MFVFTIIFWKWTYNLPKPETYLDEQDQSLEKENKNYKCN